MIAKKIAEMMVGGKPESEEVEVDPLDLMAEDVMAAVKKNDVAMLKGALKAFFVACEAREEEEY